MKMGFGSMRIWSSQPKTEREWVQPDGNSPVCDSYEARLMELLDPLIRKRANESAC